MRKLARSRLFRSPSSSTKDKQLNLIQGKIRPSASGDNGIPSKEILERHRERAITARQCHTITKTLSNTFQNLKRTDESRTELALDPKTD
ncbi:hypothetical protein Tco_0700582 [Tanacetum coccineum]